MTKTITFFGFLVIFLSSPFIPKALARIGVGVGVGKIIVDEKLKSGIIYKLPPITVVNTGDQNSDYEVGIIHHQDQSQLIPHSSWFSFSPPTFNLEPNQAQLVEVVLNLPLKTIPGDYFIYLEAHPLKKNVSGVTSVGVAAATKLYFTVSASNFFEAVFYKALSFYKLHQPWSLRITVVLAVVALIVIFRKFFNIQIGIKKK